MSLGKGGQSGSQNGAQASQYSGTTMPIAPADWLKQYSSLGNTLGGTGVTSAQQGNINSLGAQQDTLQHYVNDSGFYGLGDMSQKYGPNSSWAAPTAVSAPTVTAQQGAGFMGAYKNPYDNDVINSSVADYNTSADRAANQMRASRDASGAFGDRSALADAQFNSDTTRGLGSMVSGLRQQGFNTQAGLGMQDAGNALQASNANASNSLAAQTFNNNMTNNRQQFDVGTGFQGDQQRMGALNQQQNGILAQNAIQTGGIGSLLSYLGQGTSLFGQQASGNSSGTSNGNSSSKGGGLSLG